MFINRSGGSVLASSLDRDGRGPGGGDGLDKTKKEVHFRDDLTETKNIISQEYDSNNTPNSFCLENDSNPLKNAKVKKYRRFTKLLYGDTDEDVPKQEELLPDNNVSKFNLQSANRSNDLNGWCDESASRDAVDVAEEVESLISSTLSPTKCTVPSVSSPGIAITGYLKGAGVEFNEEHADKSVGLTHRSVSSSRRSKVFSPDATYRDQADIRAETHMFPEISTSNSDIAEEYPVIKIHRAVKLPEMLSGCNPYIIIDWGEFGEAVTISQVSGTSPVFKEILRFQRGYFAMSEPLNYPPIDVYAFHKNVSISDEFIGKGHISEVNISSGVHFVHLFDSDGDDVGEIVLELCIPLS